VWFGTANLARYCLRMHFNIATRKHRWPLTRVHTLSQKSLQVRSLSGCIINCWFYGAWHRTKWRVERIVFFSTVTLHRCSGNIEGHFNVKQAFNNPTKYPSLFLVHVSITSLLLVHHHHHHHISAMELGHLLTRSGLTYPEVSSKVCHDSFCQMENSVSLPWVIYYETFYLHVISSFSFILVIYLELVLFLVHL
jgi:hypothetical protein